jgi:hypothetical protein
LTSSRDDRRELSSARRSIVPVICLLLAAAMCAGCASHSEAKRPTVYRGGQYYGDAVHSYDLASQ